MRNDRFGGRFRTGSLLRAALAVVTVAAPLKAVAVGPVPETPEEFYAKAAAEVEANSKLKNNERRAKNVIFFVGDGFGISTLTAARILEGQTDYNPLTHTRELNGKKGEENKLAFEMLPYLALSKTYSANQQTPDSAPTMTAMVTGTKAADGELSVTHLVPRGDWVEAAKPENRLVTILELAEMAGKSTGVVSTARITHATPAACYAHSPERNWEADSNLSAGAKAADYPDIARQLIEFPYGDGLEVAMGGGRRYFLPTTVEDPEDAGATGVRTDGRNLTAEWASSDPNAAFVWNQSGFDAIDPATTSRLLGLFERSHMEYEHDRWTDTGGEPSLTEMTEKAIQILSKNPEGFFLHVEAGRIDHAHHAGNAYRALTDTIELSNAVRKAMEMVDLKDTLIIVTADHSHVFTIAGYPQRGNPILGKVVSPGSGGVLRDYDPSNFSKDALGLPYTTLGYANGPGYTGGSSEQAEGSKTYPHFGSGYSGITFGRPDLTFVETRSPEYMQEATVPLSSETHAGEDVAIFAGGPGAYLFQGVMEQSSIYHVMARAFKLDNGMIHGKGHNKHD